MQHPRRTRVRTREGETDASPQAQDFTVEHTTPPFAVEGGHAHAGHVRSVQREAARSYGVPHVRNVRQAAGPRRLIVDDLSAILTRVLGEHAAHLRTDTPLRSLGLDPEGWVCLSWALDGRIGDVDLDSVETVGDLRRVIA
jgi:hypothetical protein